MKVARGLQAPPYKASIAAKTSVSREDRHKPGAILRPPRPVWKVFFDVIPRRVRPFGAEGGLTRIGWGWWWVGARSKCDSELKACLLLLAVSEVRGKTGPSGVQGPPGHLEPH